MTEKKPRFTNRGEDIFQYGGWWCSAKGEHCADVIATAMNELLKENEQLKKDNNELIEKIKKLEKEIHLIHMSSMFSTVKSFKGDVSKRYTYNEETDTIYDTANNYGQYHKILDKKEITMLLNEYETILNGGNKND